MAEHTPGPWTVRDDRIGNWTGNVCDLGWGIRVTRQCGPPDDIPEEEESRANAHLIAAAPELLDALKEMRERMQIHMKHTEDLIADMKAVKAISKAEGK